MSRQNYSNHFILLIFCILIAGKSFSLTSAIQNSRQFIVVIDPGHGGKDPGAVNKLIREKDVVLAIGLKLGKLINENHPDVKVIFTRHADVFIPLIERSRIANKSKADLFISIHANFCGTPSTRGTETFVLGLHRSEDNLEVAKKENSVILLEDDYSTTYADFDPNSAESYIMFENVQDAFRDQSVSFANNIQQQFKAKLESSNRGVKEAGFLVLRQSSMPSVLIESGFLSNKAEANSLISHDGQQQIALSILEAFGKFKSKSSGSVHPNDPEVNSHQKHQEEAPNKKIITENQKTEKNNREIIVEPIINSKKSEPENVKSSSSVTPTDIETSKTNAFYSVQIAANTHPVEPISANFKGLRNVRREKDDQYYRYFIGNESTTENITSLLKQVKLKFPQAFIVSFVDGKRIPFNMRSK